MGHIVEEVKIGNIFISYYNTVATFIVKIDVSALFSVCGSFEYWSVQCPVL